MWSRCAECQNNNWPLSNFRTFQNAQSKFQHGAFTLYTWPIKFMKNWKNGRPFQISNFAFWYSACRGFLFPYVIVFSESSTDESQWGCAGRRLCLQVNTNHHANSTVEWVSLESIKVIFTAVNQSWLLTVVITRIRYIFGNRGDTTSQNITLLVYAFLSSLSCHRTAFSLNPRLLHLQFFDRLMYAKQREKAWGISLHDPQHGWCHGF